MATTTKAMAYGVGEAIGCNFETGERYFTARTLQDQGFNISVTQEEIRGGPGNALIGKYFHDSGLAITLNEAQFDLQFIALNVGAKILRNDGVALTDTVLTADATGNVDISNINVGPIFPEAPASTFLYWRLSTQRLEDAKVVTWALGMTSLNVGIENANQQICLQYFQEGAVSQSLRMSSEFVPQIITLILRYPLYAGSATLTGATKIGELQILIPRFQLDGNMDYALTSSGTAAVPLSGAALSVEQTSCEGQSGYYGTFRVIPYNGTWYDGLEEFIIEGYDAVETAQAGGSDSPILIDTNNSLGTNVVVSINDFFTIMTDIAGLGEIRGVFDDGGSQVIPASNFVFVSAASNVAGEPDPLEVAADGSTLTVGPLSGGAGGNVSGIITLGPVNAGANAPTLEIYVTFTSSI